VVELPALGAPMFLVLGEGMNFRSRLEAVGEDTFEVAAPLETASPAELHPGHELEVFWVPPRTRVILPCRLVAVRDGAPYRWTLAPAGEPQPSNRREFVRGGAGAAVRLKSETGDLALEGRLLDISEGGLRCWIPGGVKTERGDGMTTVLWLGTEEAELEGRVHSVREAPDAPGQHLVLTFTAPENVARLIRQYIIAWEIGERRAGRV